MKFSQWQWICWDSIPFIVTTFQKVRLPQVSDMEPFCSKWFASSRLTPFVLFYISYDIPSKSKWLTWYDLSITQTTQKTINILPKQRLQTLNVTLLRRNSSVHVRPEQETPTVPNVTVSMWSGSAVQIQFHFQTRAGHKRYSETSTSRPLPIYISYRTET